MVGGCANIAAIGAPVVEHRAREIVICDAYAVISRASVYRNCFLITPRGIRIRYSKVEWNYAAGHYSIRNSNICTPL